MQDAMKKNEKKRENEYKPSTRYARVWIKCPKCGHVWNPPRIADETMYLCPRGLHWFPVDFQERDTIN